MKKKKPGFFENISISITKFSGSTTAFISAMVIIIAWLGSGSFFDYSETWQLIINSTTTIITFIMVFIIQRTQNKDSKAIQLKLNEIIAAIKGASNRLIDVEDLSEEDLNILKKHYLHLVKLHEKEFSVQQSHSIEEAAARHKVKLQKNKKGVE